MDQKGSDRPKIDQAILGRTFQQLSAHFQKISDFLGVGETARYSNSSSYFNFGDAYIYSAFICELKPKLIIEVGCGFSSACALDTTERLGIDTKFVFIEPNPDRLYKLLSPIDRTRSRILEMPVQDVGFDVFAELDAGDILFLDTTHICKTGSDVNHELFHILPRLKAGVLIHFHDIFDSWEYPLEWIGEQNRSWNEIYALRAFLMFNTEFEIVYFNDFMWRHHRQEIEQTPLGSVLCSINGAGSGLYLRRR
ncbi:class I SAM-dependent methyltransferase [Bradyrhizobium retamae]|uniref:class I SAM-dependent methyltransferase n=1 Tax=Bradyrhizobium retamae TaxID=1300035 RepID=UPI00070A5F95|nr:class I SAM-dependent methyltransferase [Bradyrhizobium retamae]